MRDENPEIDVVADALARAISFLERRQLSTGELPVLASGNPDPAVFPTAVMTHSLSFAPDASQVQERALDFLAGEMNPRGLWKHWPREHPHHRELPPDLDDTSCASAVLARAGRTFPDNRKFLLANRNSRGLYFTWKLTAEQYRHPLALFFFFRKTSAKPFDIDSVVNASVLFYLGAITETRPVVDHLLRVLRENRETSCDKWYDNPFVIWYFFSRALHDVAPEAGEMIVRKIGEATPSNALECALAACSLAYWNRAVNVDAILAAQLESGAWPAAPVYHGGRRRRRDGLFDDPHPDTPRWGSEEWTTAFCIEALSRAART
ncbi:MAG TPA: prenyltransferase/squalene oxidase repeat-containing protein [Thermoanaerobaculia bacterium]|nr:prenyltransferase/squalene oxidase repeat-containing protein [Thermoanaerobaculia bacterium]